MPSNNTLAMKKHQKALLLLLVVLITTGFDQVSKIWARTELLPNERIPLVANRLMLTVIDNPGGIYGLGKSLAGDLRAMLYRWVPLAGVVVMSIFVLLTQSLGNGLLFGFSLIIGGGSGNTLDRWLYDTVTDFIWFDFGFVKSGVFNLADFWLVLGGAIVLIGSFPKVGMPQKTNV
jgi:signal peptidase II